MTAAAGGGPTVSDETIDAVIAAGRTERHDVVRAVESATDVAFTWDYDRNRIPLAKLYEKAKHSQWNGTYDLPWSTDVDQESVAHQLDGGGTAHRFAALAGAE